MMQEITGRYKQDSTSLETADGYGNATCKVCGRIQSPGFHACIYCCKHDELRLTEDWHEGGGWELDVECSNCGKDFDFSHDFLIQEYKVVRKSPLRKEIL